MCCKKFWLLPCALLMLCLFTACKRDFKTFEYACSIESVSNYKMVFTFDQNKHYKTEVYNYFMDRKSHKPSPKIKEGTLSDEEYAAFYQLLKQSDLLGMEDMYGFDDDAPDRDGVLTQIVLTADGETKYITIRNLSAQKFPEPFQQLLKKSVEFIK